MLTNLLKYEFKATGRVVLPIASGVLVLNIFTGILSHFIQNTSDRFPLAGLALVLLNLAALVSLLVVLAVCFFIEVQQFYRLLGDRGYLMLALPVQPWKHIAARLFAARRGPCSVCYFLPSAVRCLQAIFHSAPLMLRILPSGL